VGITLNHTIVPARDKEASARFFAELMGLRYDGPHGHFAPVRVNESLTLDFDNREQFESHHLAFHVGDEDFDAILARLQAKGLPYGSGPREQDDMQINHREDGRGLYFRDLDGHSFEVMTRV
jgi:catechol 2,3-dioxygenase-like lactoylglutathione lyase family enzyme